MKVFNLRSANCPLLTFSLLLLLGKLHFLKQSSPFGVWIWLEPDDAYQHYNMQISSELDLRTRGLFQVNAIGKEMSRILLSENVASQMAVDADTMHPSRL